VNAHALPFQEPILRSRRCETAEIVTAGRVRQFTVAATGVYKISLLILARSE
jgi:hypothetical protein